MAEDYPEESGRISNACLDKKHDECRWPQCLCQCHPTPPASTDALENLVTTAVKLAIIRHDLGDCDGELNEQQAGEIADCVWGALCGRGTCDPTPAAELVAARALTPPPSTDAELAADREAIASASPGPWRVRSGIANSRGHRFVVVECDSEQIFSDGGCLPKNAAFVARARDRWPVLVEEVAALRAFKQWVHAYLDGKGIPTHPDGPHSKEGCRIGDRMDLVFAEFERLRSVSADYKQASMDMEKLIEEARGLAADRDRLAAECERLRAELRSTKVEAGKTLATLAFTAEENAALREELATARACTPDEYTLVRSCERAAQEARHAAERENAALKARLAAAQAAVDGVNVAEGHVRDNSTADELRAKLLGAGLKIANLEARLAEAEAALAATRLWIFNCNHQRQACLNDDDSACVCGRNAVLAQAEALEAHP